MDRVTIALSLPPKGLSPNDRAHWRTKAKATATYREEARLVGAITRPPSAPWKTVVVEATFYHRAHRDRDADNLLASLKAAFDGLADANVFEDDRRLIHLPVVQLPLADLYHGSGGPEVFRSGPGCVHLDLWPVHTKGDVHAILEAVGVAKWLTF